MTGVPFRLDPAHTALVIVDVQNDFCDPRGSLGTFRLESHVPPYLSSRNVLLQEVC